MDEQVNASCFTLVLSASHIANQYLGLGATRRRYTSRLFELRHCRQALRATALSDASRSIAVLEQAPGHPHGLASDLQL